MAQINKPDDYFNTKLYTGNGSTQSITGVGFQPDWVWIKDRDNATNHMVFDSVRGTGEELHTQNTDSETTQANTLTAFGSDGFSLGSNSDVNNSSQNFVAWNFLASNTTASNTDGDITSTVSANTTAGFSIVTYTGNGTQTNTEVGTGLSTSLDMIISKPLDTGGGTDVWIVYVKNVTEGTGDCLLLNTTDARLNGGAGGGTNANGTTAGNLIIKPGSASNNNLNNSGTRYVSYCFSSVKGYSKIGSYTGNGSTDGTFIYTGFKPAWIMIKRTDSAGGWVMFDNKRNSFNVMDETLLANVSDAETVYANQIFDFVSNGLKVRGTANSSNASGASYIYMCFAENPLVGTNNIPATAR